MSTTGNDLLQSTVDSVLGDRHVDLEELQLVHQGRRTIVRISVDADGGVDVDQCADISRALARAFDDGSVMGEAPYTLEVSSRGVSRPLTLPRHWRRNVGRLVKVVLHDGDTVVGRIADADDDAARLEVEGGADREVGYDAVRRAKVQVEFREADADESGED